MDLRHDPELARRNREVLWVLLLTAAFQAGTMVLRFGFDLQSTRDTPFLKPYTFGLRIHHGYVGAVLVWIAWLGREGWFPRWLRRLGLALVLSDLIHHFLVLWPLTGSPQFDLFYP
jgi:hypothetical protein